MDSGSACVLGIVTGWWRVDADSRVMAPGESPPREERAGGHGVIPRIAQWMIRTAFVWLGLGFTAGTLVLLQKAIPLAPWFWTLRLSHVHMLLIGWTVQLGVGVAYWIFPRFDTLGDRGVARWWLLGYLCLNGGVFAAAANDPVALLVPTIGHLLAVVSGILYISAAVALVPVLWQRVLPFHSHTRRSNSTGKEPAQPQ